METVKQKSGIILIDKTVGPTSRQIVNVVSRILQTKKVGHIGTLDPFATGLLILTVNRGTKIGAYLEALDKTYVAKLNLGVKTDTGDLTGQVIKTMEIPPSLSENQVLRILSSFIGKRLQIPPMYSALKRDGKPLYKYAREGKTLERAPREITIHSFDLLSFNGSIVEFKTRVSKGTYIRTLGEDIAEALETVGHLVSLRRMTIGAFDVNDACQVDEASFSKLISINKSLSHLKRVTVDDSLAKDIKNGKPINLEENDNLILLINSDEALAIYERREDGLYYSRRGLFF